MSQLCVTPKSRFLFHPVMRAPASLEFAGMPWMPEHLQHYEHRRGFPWFASLGDVMPNQRHIVFEPYDGVYDQFNVTEALCREEWNDISPDTFQKLNAIRALTGEKLHRLLTDIFQENLTKTDFYYRAGNYFILEHNRAPVCWIFGQSLCWGEDIPSLWAHLHQTSYVDAIYHIFDHLGDHESTAEFSSDNKKGYWTQELTPLALDIHAPWRFYSPVAIGGASIFNYFRNGILVGCSCSIPHTLFGELTTFFSLMRHSKTRLLRWFSLYPEAGLFFQDDLPNEMKNDVLFMPDESAALEEVHKPGHKSARIGVFSYPVPLACPGGLNRLHTADVTMTVGKRVHIVVPEMLQQDEPFLSRIEQKFSGAGAVSVQFYPADQRHSQAFRKTDFDRAKMPSVSAGWGITKPGEKIPGSDIIRKKVLYPLIESGQLIWLYGPEKSGKSWLARSMAHVISYGGTFLEKYEAATGLKVLYIDSELEPDKLEQAAAKELKGLGFTDGIKFARKVARARDNPSGEINLYAPEWQSWFNAVIPAYDVIFLDCYYSLTGSSNTPKKLLKLLTPWKSKGKTFIVVDHTNKEGELQGGIDKKRAADLCIEVTPQDEQCVEVSFPTVRHLGPEDTKSFTLRRIFENTVFRFEVVESEPESEPALSLSDSRTALAYVWRESKGLQLKELAGYLGYGTSSVYGWVKKVKTQQDRKSGPSAVFAALLEQIQRYESFTEAELREEAHRLVKV